MNIVERVRLARIAADNKERLAKKEAEERLERDNPFNMPIDYREFAARCRIRSGNSFVQFETYDFQSVVNQIIDDHENTIIVKDRQLGMTETIGCRLLHQIMLTRSVSVAVISMTQKKSSEVSERIQLMPSAMTMKWKVKSATKIRPAGCGEAHFLPSVPDAARSLPSVKEFLFDEAGFVENMIEIYGCAVAAQEMVPASERKAVLISTIPPEGPLSEFWGMFDDANGDILASEMLDLAREGGTNCGIPGLVWWTDEGGWAKIVISHKAHPLYGKDPNYLEKTKKRKKLTEAVLQREHNLGLNFGQGSLFWDVFLRDCAVGSWEGPIKGERYIASIDPNFGGEVDSDNWATQIWKLSLDGKQPHSLVAEYAEANRTTEYSRTKSIEMFEKYDPELIAVESNSGGKIVLEQLSKERPGMRFELVLTSHVSKRVNTDRIALGIENGEFMFPADWEGIAEMKRFSALKREASSGKDDRVMSFAAMGVWLDEIVGTVGAIGRVRANQQ